MRCTQLAAGVCMYPSTTAETWWRSLMLVDDAWQRGEPNKTLNGAAQQSDKISRYTV